MLWHYLLFLDLQVAFVQILKRLWRLTRLPLLPNVFHTLVHAYHIGFNLQRPSFSRTIPFRLFRYLDGRVPSLSLGLVDRDLNIPLRIPANARLRVEGSVRLIDNSLFP